MVDQPTRQMEISPTLEKETLVPPPRRRRGFFRRWFVRFLKLGVVLGVLGIAVCVWMYQVYVVRNPGEHLERDYILSLISQEAPVYYRDGTTRLGVFFSEEHRQYVPYESIPDDFVNALVAAEDQDFFDHPGFSPRGITRAFMVNLRRSADDAFFIQEDVCDPLIVSSFIRHDVIIPLPGGSDAPRSNEHGRPGLRFRPTTWRQGQLPQDCWHRRRSATSVS